MKKIKHSQNPRSTTVFQCFIDDNKFIIWLHCCAFLYRMITPRSSNLITEILSFLSRRETQKMIKKAQQLEEGKGL